MPEHLGLILILAVAAALTGLFLGLGWWGWALFPAAAAIYLVWDLNRRIYGAKEGLKKARGGYIAATGGQAAQSVRAAGTAAFTFGRHDSGDARAGPATSDTTGARSRSSARCLHEYA